MRPSSHTYGVPPELVQALVSEEEDADVLSTRTSSTQAINEVDAISVSSSLTGPCSSLRTFLQYAGPGWLMSLAYLDPGNLEADLQSGAFTGFQLVWVLLGAHIIGLVLQCLAVRLGVGTDMDLAQLCRKSYPGWLSMILWVMTEIAIAGSDLQEVIGTATAFHLLFGWPLWVGCLVTALDTVTFLLVHIFKGTRLLEAFIFLCVALLCGSFFTDFALARPDSSEVLSGFVPSVSSYAIPNMVGMVGAVIMPHNIFLHSSLVRTRRLHRRDPDSIKQAVSYHSLDSLLALSVSFLVNMAIMCSFAQGFFSPHCAANPNSPLGCFPAESLSSSSPLASSSSECLLSDCSCSTPSGLPGVCRAIGLANAGASLAAWLPSSQANLFFAVGVLGAGQASTLTGTLAGQYVMEGFLSMKLPLWQRTLLTRSVALGPALSVALLVTDVAMMNQLNQLLNILQSLQLPFAVLPLLAFSSRRRLMGSLTLKGRSLLLCVFLTFLVLLINAYLVWSQVDSWSWWGSVLISVYSFIILYLFWDLWNALCKKD